MEAEIESQDKTIDNLIECQTEREKYTHSLEKEIAKLRIDNTDNLCEECSQLAKEAGITEEDTRRILKDYRDKVENSIPISVIQNKIECFKYEEEMLEKGIGSWTHDEIIELYAKLNILQEILEKGNK